MNLTSLSDGLIFELEKYLEYVQKQESQLSEIEKQKNILSNTFFKDNKDLFINQGGDIEKLFNEIKYNHCLRIFRENKRILKIIWNIWFLLLFWRC